MSALGVQLVDSRHTVIGHQPGGGALTRPAVAIPVWATGPVLASYTITPAVCRRARPDRQTLAAGTTARGQWVHVSERVGGQVGKIVGRAGSCQGKTPDHVEPSLQPQKSLQITISVGSSSLDKAAKQRYTRTWLNRDRGLAPPLWVRYRRPSDHGSVHRCPVRNS